MLRRLYVKHQCLSQRLNAISGRSTNHAAGGETEAFDVFSITDTEAINERLKDHGALFRIERSGNQIKVVDGKGGRIGTTKVYLTIRESGNTPKLFMVEDDSNTTKAYVEKVSSIYASGFDKMVGSTLLNGPRYHTLISAIVRNTNYTEPAIGSVYTCLTNDPYVTVYKEDTWIGRQ